MKQESVYVLWDSLSFDTVFMGPAACILTQLQVYHSNLSIHCTVNLSLLLVTPLLLYWVELGAGSWGESAPAQNAQNSSTTPIFLAKLLIIVHISLPWSPLPFFLYLHVFLYNQTANSPP